MPGLVEVIGNVDGLAIDSVTLNHRNVAPGIAFACVAGARFDGNAFAEDAVASGAPVVFSERPLALSVPVVLVVNVNEAIGEIAAALEGDPSRTLMCFGVTGTNGKTTTTYLLDGISAAGGHPSAILGTTGVRIGSKTLATGFTTPQAPELQHLLRVCQVSGAERVAMEVSSHALDQHRIDGTHFAVVGFTNLTRDHLDYHGDEDAYFDAKARLFHPRFASTAVINMDDPRGPKLADLATDQGLVVWGFGSDRAPRRRTEHSIEIVSIDLGPHGFAAQLRVDTDPVELCSTLLGNFNVENATLALGMALAVGDPISTVLEGLRAPRLVPGRMQAIPARDRVAIVDYAHTPDALERVLRTARELGARVLVVFGCGGDRDRGKRPLMGAIAVDNADVVVVTSDNPRSEDPQAIVSEILEGLDRTQVTVQLDRAEAIRTAVEGSQPGDVIVIAGKGHEATQTIGDDVRVFDDAEVLKAAIQECGLAP